MLPPPLVQGRSRERYRSWKICCHEFVLSLKKVYEPGSDLLHFRIVEECLIVWDVVEPKIMVGQDHLLEWQPKLYIRSVFHSSSMPENWANNIRQIFTHNHRDSQNPDEEFSLVSALKHHDMTWHDIMKNAYWFATIPTVGNQHSTSARLYHLLNVFSLLGKAPGKEEMLDNADDNLLFLHHFMAAKLSHFWAPGEWFLTAYGPNHCLL